MGEVLKNGPEGETEEGDIVKLRPELPSKHPDCLGWIDGVQSSITAICEKHSDEVRGIVEDRPFDGGTADHENSYHDVLDSFEWHHV